MELLGRALRADIPFALCCATLHGREADGHRGLHAIHVVGINAGDGTSSSRTRLRRRFSAGIMRSSRRRRNRLPHSGRTRSSRPRRHRCRAFGLERRKQFQLSRAGDRSQIELFVSIDISERCARQERNSAVKPTIHLIIIALLLTVAGVAVDAWLGARSDSAKLAATLSAQKNAIEQAAKQERDRDKLLASTVAAITAEKRRVQSPQQAAKALPLDLPELPQPITAQPAGSVTSTASNDIPPAPLTIPIDDIKPLYDHLEDCRICAAQRDTAQQDLADQTARNAALTKERNAAVVAAKGGNFWARTRRAAKWFAIGLAIGASAAAASHRTF